MRPLMLVLIHLMTTILPAKVPDGTFVKINMEKSDWLIYGQLQVLYYQVMRTIIRAFVNGKRFYSR